MSAPFPETVAPRPVRAPRRRVDGVIVLDKPVGLTSNAALQRARRLYAAEKAGHTGTLDPLASGLLPLCFGDATKFAQALLDSDKEYVATVRMGIGTTTGDSEGSETERGRNDFTRDDIERVLPAFTGAITQIPPRHSALKYQGRNYYDYARKGVEIPRAARSVTVHAVRVVDCAPPDVVLLITCSKGTYIRVLAEDIGRALGSCAHLTALRRTATGPFTLAGAVTLDALEALAPPALDALLLPSDVLLDTMPRQDVDHAVARALRQGKRAGTVDPAAHGRFRCYGPNAEFLGIVECSGGELRPVRLLRTDASA
jgi:tRNA pseudouridine55 synthase